MIDRETFEKLQSLRKRIEQLEKNQETLIKFLNNTRINIKNGVVTLKDF